MKNEEKDQAKLIQTVSNMVHGRCLTACDFNHFAV